MAEMVAEHRLAGGAHRKALLQRVAAPAVTQATSGAKPLTSSPSFFSRLSGMSTGMATFSWPVALKRASRFFWMFSQMA